jgi:predicted PurR-regulated permease PerM
MTLETITIILGILVVIFGYTTFNLLKKAEKLEDLISKYSDFINEFGDQIDAADKRLKQIDDKGMFQSDDEIGWFFEQIKVIQKSISRFKIN